jgi:mannose-6-phosphate isomerase
MLADYLEWITASALPFWAERGFDRQAGRFHERLDLTGAALALPHRAMVQARQIFVFAHAAEQGWAEDCADMAERAMAALLRDFAANDGDETSFAFAIDPASGAVCAAQRDAYAHAFILFALAALHRLNGDAKLLDTADRTIRFVERRLTDPQHGGLFDALPAPRVKRQNPHMHLLEALLFLEDAAPGRGYIERAAGLVALFERHFLHKGMLLEYFEQDWSPTQRMAWEPGHHFEWAWLLHEYAAQTGAQPAAPANRLYDLAIAHGVAANGLVVDEIGADLVVMKSAHRLWPHTEAIKAAAARRREGDPAAHGFAEAMAARLMGTFLKGPFPGGWIDHVGPGGAPIVDYVPASSLYHLLMAASVAAKDFAAAPALAKTAS